MRRLPRAGCVTPDASVAESPRAHAPGLSRFRRADGAVRHAREANNDGGAWGGFPSRRRDDPHACEEQPEADAPGCPVLHHSVVVRRSVLVLLVAQVADERGAAYAAAARGALGDQQARGVAIDVRPTLAVLVIRVEVVVRLGAILREAREQDAAHATA